METETTDFVKSPIFVKRPKLTHGVTLTTEAYPEFMFRHKFSLLVVGPTQCGKMFNEGSYSLRDQETERHFMVLQSVAR